MNLNDSLSPKNLKRKVLAAWASIEAPPSGQLDILEWEYGEDTVRAFSGVRPSDVDINSVGFLAATPLYELPSEASAAYLGPYLVSLLEGFQIQQVMGSPPDIKTRSHTIHAISRPRFFSDVVLPNLNDTCIISLSEVVELILRNSKAFSLSEDENRGLHRLLRSLARQLRHGSR